MTSQRSRRPKSALDSGVSRPAPKPVDSGSIAQNRPGGSATATPNATRSMSITIGVAGATWLAGWLGGNIAATIVLSLTGQASTDAALRSVWASAVTTVALWVPQIIALVIASRRFGTGRILRDYAVRFRPVDLVGLPIGVLSQLVLLRLVYWPLQTMWPGAFSTDELERNARDLYERASGVWVVVLFAVVTVGAPLVEELVYRGLLGGAARRRFHEVVALVGVAAFFALIHFRPVEYPGLFAFGLVLGVCLAATNRIGMGILAHVAFNATALALIA